MAGKQRYFIELSFNGTAYHGWQIQKNAVSVQEVLNKKLSVVLRQAVETTGCGRTDTGVHAREFFAHFDAEKQSIVHGPLPMDGEAKATIDHRQWTIDYENLLRSINAVLPSDIAVKRIFRVADNANARFDAILRSYEYHIHFTKDPFKNGYSWEMRDEPDIDLMNKAAKIIMEYTDFSCFSKSNTQVKTNICKISNAEWTKCGDGIVFKIYGQCFS